MLEMRRLQILAALEMSTTMTSAAARLHMTPSAVSHRILTRQSNRSSPGVLAVRHQLRSASRERYEASHAALDGVR